MRFNYVNKLLALVIPVLLLSSCGSSSSSTSTATTKTGFEGTAVISGLVTTSASNGAKVGLSSNPGLQSSIALASSTSPVWRLVSQEDQVRVTGATATLFHWTFGKGWKDTSLRASVVEGSYQFPALAKGTYKVVITKPDATKTRMLRQSVLIVVDENSTSVSGDVNDNTGLIANYIVEKVLSVVGNAALDESSIGVLVTTVVSAVEDLLSKSVIKPESPVIDYVEDTSLEIDETTEKDKQNFTFIDAKKEVVDKTKEIQTKAKFSSVELTQEQAEDLIESLFAFANDSSTQRDVNVPDIMVEQFAEALIDKESITFDFLAQAYVNSIIDDLPEFKALVTKQLVLDRILNETGSALEDIYDVYDDPSTENMTKVDEDTLNFVKVALFPEEADKRIALPVLASQEINVNQMIFVITNSFLFDYDTFIDEAYEDSDEYDTFVDVFDSGIASFIDIPLMMEELGFFESTPDDVYFTFVDVASFDYSDFFDDESENYLVSYVDLFVGEDVQDQIQKVALTYQTESGPKTVFYHNLQDYVDDIEPEDSGSGPLSVLSSDNKEDARKKRLKMRKQKYPKDKDRIKKYNRNSNLKLALDIQPPGSGSETPTDSETEFGLDQFNNQWFIDEDDEISDHISGEVTIEVWGDDVGDVILASTTRELINFAFDSIDWVYPVIDDGDAISVEIENNLAELEFDWTDPTSIEESMIPEGFSLVYAFELYYDLEPFDSELPVGDTSFVDDLLAQASLEWDFQDSEDRNSVTIWDSFEEGVFLSRSEFIPEGLLPTTVVDEDENYDVAYIVNVTPLIIDDLTQTIVWEDFGLSNYFYFGESEEWSITLNGTVTLPEDFADDLPELDGDIVDGTWKIGIFKIGGHDLDTDSFEDTFFKDESEANFPLSVDSVLLIDDLGSTDEIDAVDRVVSFDFPNVMESDDVLQEAALYSIFVWYDQDETSDDTIWDTVGSVTDDAIDYAGPPVYDSVEAIGFVGDIRVTPRGVVIEEYSESSFSKTLVSGDEVDPVDLEVEDVFLFKSNALGEQPLFRASLQSLSSRK